MESQMDAIINQLSHIEGTAVRIMESAESQKKELSLEMEQRTREYDARLAEDTGRQLDTLKETLNAQKNAELSRLKAEAAHDLQKLENSYQENHTIWAKEILHSIIGA